MGRVLRSWAVVVVCLGSLLLADAAHASPGKCETFVVFDPVCEAGKTVADHAVGVATAPVRYAANGAVDAITLWVTDAAEWTVKRAIGFIDDSTTPALGSGWFSERYRFMLGLGALVILPLLLMATMRAVVTQDMNQLLRSFFVYLPVGILGAFVAVHLTQALLGITDAMSAAVADRVAGDLSRIFGSIGGTLSGAGPAVPSFAVFFGALLLIVGSFFVWLELLVRSAAVTAAVFFLPLILSGLVWPASMRWTKRLIEILVALILSKFVIVAVISLATAALAEPGGGGFGTVMGAAALMLMAAFSPFAVLKLVPMVEGAAIDHLQGRGRSAVQTVRPHGGLNQMVSVMKAKTASGSYGRGLAVAGAASVPAARAGTGTAKPVTAATVTGRASKGSMGDGAVPPGATEDAKEPAAATPRAKTGGSSPVPQPRKKERGHG